MAADSPHESISHRRVSLKSNLLCGRAHTYGPRVTWLSCMDGVIIGRSMVLCCSPWKAFVGYASSPFPQSLSRMNLGSSRTKPVSPS